MNDDTPAHVPTPEATPAPTPEAPPTPVQPPAGPARHPVSIGHLVMGIALLGLVGVWTLHVTGAVASGDVHWLLPAPWVLAGVAGLVALLASDRRRGRPAPEAPATPGPVSPGRSDTMGS